MASGSQPRRGTSNRFDMLKDNTGDKDIDLSSLGLNPESLVENAVKGIKDRRSNKGVDKALISDIVSAVLAALTPVILKVSSVNSNQVNACLPALQKITQQNAFDNNAHKQYSRREHILITGIQESEKEDPIQECVNILMKL